MKSLILGADGFLGKNISDYLEKLQGKESVVREIRKFLNPLDVKKAIIESAPNLVINCIAMTDADACKKNPELALWVNGELPGIIAAQCKQIGIKLIHVSTDAVMDVSRSFKCESEPPNPGSVYGSTKLLGEKKVLNEESNFLVCRVNFFGFSHKRKSLMDYFVHNILEMSSCPGYTNVFFNPLGITTTIKLILELESQGSGGLFHVVGDTRISKFEFGKEIEKILSPNKQLVLPAVEANECPQMLRDLTLCNCKLRLQVNDIPKWKLELSREMGKLRTYYEDSN